MRSRHVLWSALLLCSCAQVRDPEGGPKDTEAPELVSAEPPNGSTGFTARRIVLRFNERVRLDRVREKLLISPPLPSTPNVRIAGGDQVVIDLKDVLQPNTTYTFNIGDAVLDLTEGNAAKGLFYVVSTGDHLDSGRVSGRVLDAFTGEPVKDALVMVRLEADTGNTRIGPPHYFGRSDDKGAFELSHLRQAEYRLSALLDQNANYRYDLPNEDIAFLPAPVNTGDSAQHVLRLFRQPPDSQRVMSARVLPERGWELVLARRWEQGTLSDVDRTGAALTWSPEWNVAQDTVIYWPSDTAQLDERRFAYSEAGHVLDTLTYRASGKMAFYLDARTTGNVGDTSFALIASRPLRTVDSTRISLTIDSLRSPLSFTVEGAAHRRLRPLRSFPANGSLRLELLPHALKDVYGGSNDTLRFELGGKAPAKNGDLKVNLSLADRSTRGPWILQLLGAHDALVRSINFDTLPATADWPHLTAGQYTLRLIQDSNADGRWTGGSLTEQRLPEAVIRYAESINVRADWEVGTDWVLTAP